MREQADRSLGEVIAAVRAGDVDAYGEIVRRYQHELYRIAAYVLRDRSATEDLVQEAFVKAYLSLERFDARLDFGAWLRTICRNLVRNELRRAMRSERTLRRYYGHLLCAIEDDDQAERFERSVAEALAACRGQLAPAAAHALALRYEEAREFEEIAALLDRTVAAVRQLLTRVRLELRRCISQRLYGRA